MAFWGVKLEPEKPYTHTYNSSPGRLRISQATFGDCSSPSGYAGVQCKVGNTSPVSLCSMHTDTDYGSRTLDIEFEEKENDVVFEVIGGRSVHLTGFYLGQDGQSRDVATWKVGNYVAPTAYVVPTASQIAEMRKIFSTSNPMMTNNFIDQRKRNQKMEEGINLASRRKEGKKAKFASKTGSSEAYELEMGGEYEYKDTIVNGRHVRTMASGLIIEELQTSANRKIAYHGCGVKIRYFAQIRSTGYVFESNYSSVFGKSFRLGTGVVIKGLDDGINGMRVGGRRRLTVPPSMGYCGLKARNDVPVDAWVVLEVDLEDIDSS